jgi:hypothetical protein
MQLGFIIMEWLEQGVASQDRIGRTLLTDFGEAKKN